MREAGDLQRGVKHDEKALPGINDYTDDDVRQAVVHTRQDVVLLVSLLDSLNSQVRWVKWLPVVIAIAAIYIAFKVSR